MTNLLEAVPTAKWSWTLLIGSTTSPEKLKREGDVLVDLLVFNPEAVESINEDSAYVKISNVGPNDHGIGIWKNIAFFLFFGKGNGFPVNLSNLVIVPSGYAEDLRVPNDIN